MRLSSIEMRFSFIKLEGNSSGDRTHVDNNDDSLKCFYPVKVFAYHHYYYSEL